MTLEQFQHQFSSEAICADALFRLKWPDGFRCPRCENSSFYVVKTRRIPLYECQKCRHQTTVTSGTIMEGAERNCANGSQLSFSSSA
ncbi:transposase [Paenibacillus hexagrammi]|uniref:transposase n=1 Tax=Paenibacillus hexagrammi TaxID=2908839 RepID=UPI003312FC4C